MTTDATPKIEERARAAGLRLWPVAASLLVFLAGSQAQSGEQTPPSRFAHLSAVSAGGTWRQPSGISIETRDTDLDGVDGPRVETVRDTIRRALAAQGIAVTRDGSHILQFKVSSAPSPAPAAEREAIAPQQPSPGERYRPVEVTDQVTVPVDPGGDAGVSSDFAISFMLFVPGEKPLWNATITASGEVEDPTELLRAMTRAAMNALGTSVERDYTLSCTEVTVRQGQSCLP